ncbi:MAG: extracellular solute-binding protein [Acholeplasmataceae bacterium]
MKKKSYQKKKMAITKTKKVLIVIFSVLLVFFITLSFFKKTAINDYYETNFLSNDYSNTYVTSSYDVSIYTETKQMYEDESLNVIEASSMVYVADMIGNRVTVSDDTYGDMVESYRNLTQTDTDALLLSENDSITFTHQENESGLYAFAIDYYELESDIEPAQINILINGVSPFYESQTLVLPSTWKLITTDFSVDRYGNEIMPSSDKTYDWYHHEINDYRGMHPGLFYFNLEQGDEITIAYVNQEVLIGDFYYVTAADILSYDSYLQNHQSATLVDDVITVAAREMYSRNETSIRLRAEQDPSNIYYDTKTLILNVIDEDSWDSSGQAITYQVDVEESGFYNLTVKYMQSSLADMPTFREISIDGEIPFDELACFAFPYTTSFVNRTLSDADDNPFNIYLEEGTHEITFRVVNYPYRELIETIQYVMSEIQNLALDVKRYTSGGTDKYRDWEIDSYFPNAVSDILSWIELLENKYEKLRPLSDESNPSAISNIIVVNKRLQNIVDNINELPSKMVQFSDGDSSANQMLGTLMTSLMVSGMEMESFTLHTITSVEKPYSNVFVRFYEGMMRLIYSFIDNPYTIKDRGEDEIVVWVNHSRLYIEIMQQLVDEYYDGEQTITLSQMPDQNKLILANASGNAPDIAIGVDNWIPYEFAIRNASLDLRQFEGYEELVTHFSKGAMIPYAFEEGMYGIPETQNFWVTYYREDILNSIGIEDVPQTWDEIIEILPLLQSYGLNYFLPLSQYSGLKPFVATIPFIYQFGGTLYEEDGMSTAINSEETIEGITLMSDLFTLYNLPDYVGSFFNQFRYGLLPIGVSDLSTYILLNTAASELDGLWSMDLHPGVLDETTGEINRYAAVGAQSSMIMSSTEYPEESWDFLSWWMSTEIQTQYGYLLESTYGDAYLWNSANIDAFKESSIPDEFKDVILEQWEYAIEASRIPGAYMVEREISNAWTTIVFDNTNARQALDEAVRVANREILYKMEEFDYVVDGQVVSVYRVPTIDNIDYWLTEVTHD